MTNRRRVIELARSFEGVRYRHQGRTRASGIDCLGLVALVGQGAGLTNYDELHYGMLPDPANLLQKLRRYLVEIPFRETRPADILLLALHSHEPQHLAILVEPGRIIHALRSLKAVREQRLDTKLLLDIRAAFQFPGIDDGRS